MLEQRQLLASFHFDFGTTKSPVAPGYERASLEKYTPTLGHGWQDGTRRNSLIPVTARDRGTGGPLTRDFVAGRDATFIVDAPNDSYTVTVWLGDTRAERDRIDIYAEGQRVGNAVASKRGEFIQLTFPVSLPDGQLTLRLVDRGGANGRWTMNGLDIVPGSGSQFSVSAGPDRSANEGAEMAFAGTVSGGTAPFTYNWSFGDGTTTSGSPNPTHAYADNGKYTVTLSVTDGTGLVSLDTAQVSVANVAPSVQSGGPYSGTTDSPIEFSATVTDPSSVDTAARFIYAWSFGDGRTSSQASPSHRYTTGGSYTVTLDVTDKDGGQTTVTTTADVGAAVTNRAPVLAAIGNKTVQAGNTLTFTATATDQDVPPQTLTYSLDAGAPAGAAINGSSGAFSWTPAAAQANDTYSITMRVTDNGSPNLTDAKTFSVTVQAPSRTNRAPDLAAIGNKAAQAGSTLSFTATATDQDVPPQTLTFALDAGAPAGATINASSGAFSWTPTSAQANASYSVTVRVTDNGSPALSDTETIIISVRSNDGNSAPIITGVESQTVTEGQLFRIPFTVLEPDNDVVDRSVTYLVSGVAQSALPRGATFARDPKTGIYGFTWLPEFNQAGSYDFKFKASDEFGAAAEKTITITVDEALDKPVIIVVDFFQGNWGSVLLPGETYVAPYPTLRLKVAGTDPENDPFELQLQGLPGARLTQESSVSWALDWYTDNDHAGIYQATLTATDDKGHVALRTLDLDIRASWGRGKRVTPVIEGYDPNWGNAVGPRLIARGTVQFTGVQAWGFWPGETQTITGMRFRYLLNGRPISPVLTPSDRFSWDSTTVPDGSFLLDIQLLDGPNLESLRSESTLVIVDNQPGAVMEPQEIPVAGLNLDNALSAGVFTTSLIGDFIHFPGGDERPHNNVHPYPYQFIPPANTLVDPAILHQTENWVVEALTQARSSFRDTDPRVYQSAEGHLVVSGFFPREGVTTEEAYPHAQYHDHFDGGRDDNSTCPYSVFIPNPTGPGWYGVDISGRFFQVAPDGSVTTIAGYVTPRNVIPYDVTANIPLDQMYGHQKVLIGNFEGGIAFSQSNDLASDPRYPGKVFYVADTGNARIAKIDLHGPTPVITTYAGMAGSVGYQDGPAAIAKFNGPYSIVAASDGTLYVADRWNSAIRRISPDGDTVSTVVGGSMNPREVPAPGTLAATLSNRNTWNSYFPTADGSFTQAMIHYPQWIRMDSHGNLVEGESEAFALRYVDLAIGRVRTIIHTPVGANGEWIAFDVDRRGNIGAVDDIYYGTARPGEGYNGTGTYNANIQRISADGSVIENFLSDNVRNNHPSTIQNTFGHYSWIIAIDDNEGRFVTTGFGSMGINSLRIAQPTDPPVHPEDEAVFMRGFQIHLAGTVPGFPWDTRPSFTYLHGVRGHSSLGGLLHFDDLAELSDQQIADYIHSGMGGSVPRPEITGNDLRDYIYFIRESSLQGELQNVRPGPDAPDVRAPEIRNVRVTQSERDTIKIAWQTDEPTIGLIQYGPTTRHGLHTQVESGYSKEHEMLVRAWILGVQYHFTILAKDFAGNRIASTDGVFAGSSTADPPAPIGQTIVDDGGQGSSLIGAGWTGVSSGYGSHSLVAAAGVGLNMAFWQATALPVGTYAIQAAWTATADRASNALFRISDGDRLVQTVWVNQQAAPQGTIVNGVTFQTLATVTVSGGTLRVSLTDQADGSVLADAIRIVAI